MKRYWPFLLLAFTAFARTPKLNIKLAHNSAIEQRKQAQIERLAETYDLKKFTLTKDIAIDRGVANHSKPVLTLNAGFLFNDDRALSAYIHEQGHWLLGNNRSEMPRLYQDLTRTFPGMPADYPQGSGSVQDSYYHLAVLTLEWQGLEELVGPERARAVLEFKSTDHYTELYKTVLKNRPALEEILNRYRLHW
ncbi:MAG: hypothetical protein ABI811_01875 [Acidobacteriota bacterium]